MLNKPIAPETRVVRRDHRARPREYHADICVVGSGASGISAAIEAARLGLEVVLVDGLPALGGQAVNSIIGMFCGMFDNRGRQLTHGVADDILRDLAAEGALHVVKNTSQPVAMYDEVALGRWVEKTALKEGVTPLVGAVMRGVRMEGRRIKALDIANRYGDVVVEATGFVDATGDAALTWLAGLDCQEPEGHKNYGSQMLVIEGFDESKRPNWADMAKRIWDKGQSYGMTRRDGFTAAFPGRNTAIVNMTHVETPLDPFEASIKGIEGKEQADRTMAFLKAEFPEAFKEARVRAYGLPGIRQTRWIVGAHHLTHEEVRRGFRFEDSIARTAWPIEQHHNAEGYVWEPFDDDHLHYVPLRSLTPPQADNLVACGRCIDADSAALSSVRVMGPCIAMGAAAANALHLAGHGSVHRIDMAALGKRLARNLDG